MNQQWPADLPPEICYSGNFWYQNQQLLFKSDNMLMVATLRSDEEVANDDEYSR